jgi:murein endopeptidase
MQTPDDDSRDAQGRDPSDVDDDSSDAELDSSESSDFDEDVEDLGASSQNLTPPRAVRRPWWPWMSAVGALAWGIGWYLKVSAVPGDLPPAAMIEESMVEVEAEAEVGAGGAAEGEAAVEAEAAAEPSAENAESADIPELNPWLSAKELNDPNVVTYTLRFGGTLERVANLFKIYHHEIAALNPGLSLKKELPAHTKVVLYRRDPNLKSESVGFPDNGSLVGAVPMVEGPGRKLLALGWKRWATASTVATLDQVLRRWADRPQSDQPILVGNMSAREGGKLPPHGSHRSGRDVDLGYIQKSGIYEEHNWRAIDEKNLNAGETWELIRLLMGTGQVEAIFIDRAIQKLLYDHALASHLYNKNQLARLIEYPRATGSTRALIVHVNGHVDHLHVRFKCPGNQSKCRSKER